MRVAILALTIACPALAAAQSSPGTGGDVMRELMIQPALVNVELPVLAIHGGSPEDTVLLFDGFELPWAFHDNGVRSIAPAESVEIELLPSGFGVEYGRGSSVVSLSSLYGGRTMFAELTPLDLGFHAAMQGLTGSAVIGTNQALRSFDRTETPGFAGALARNQTRLSTRSTLVLSTVFAQDGERRVFRPVLALHYVSSEWHAVLAASYLQQREVELDRDAIDTRTEVLRSADAAAGLTKLEWRLGQQTNSNRYAFADPLWRHDIGAWTSIAANLSARVRATVGLRVDNFDGDVATQPRAALLGQVHPKLILALAAGAYRRPPEQLAEIGHDLNPERATHVVAGALFDDKQHLRITAMAYFIDRRRLVVRDQAGELANTGFGSSLGIDLFAQYRDGPWHAMLSTALTRSKRFDYLRAAEHPAPYEQPFRLDVIGGWKRKRLALAARLQLASGLPYTPYPGAIYDADTDTYEPLYAEPLSARAPFHHQIDLRIDYRIAKSGASALDVFLDLQNAYRNRDAIAYRYSYDYSERTAISALPLFPFVGLRGTL